MEPSPPPGEKPADKPAAAPSKRTDLLEVADAGARRKCPKCGNDNPYKIKENTDKTKILNQYPVIYGRKYACGQCGQEWRYSA